MSTEQDPSRDGTDQGTGPGQPAKPRVGRRALLTGAFTGAGLAVAAGAGVAAGVASLTDKSTKDPSGSTRVDFHGAHQAGIILPAAQQKRATVVSFDVTVDSRAELVELFRTITSEARGLTAGATLPDAAITATAPDSGVLGPEPAGDQLTVTLGVGAALFDQRFGLAGRKPAKLKPMTTFPNDNLDPARCHGDLSLQICAENLDTVLHALRAIARATRGGMQIKWRSDGFVSPPRPAGAPRNLMGFKDGTSNPDVAKTADMERLVWVGAKSPGEPTWTAGGSYQVVRVIRMLVEFWDRVSISEQENMFGRRRDSGAPLDGNHELDAPNFGLDPVGAAIPLTSHIRRANPRTADTDSSRILRRPYNYDNGVDSVGNLDMGTLFICYQQDIVRQFEATQTRLIDEPLIDYITPEGGGYFFALPGVRDDADFLGSGLFGRPSTASTNGG